VKVHFKGYHAKYDVWIDRKTSKERIRPYGRSKFVNHSNTKRNNKDATTLWSVRDDLQLQRVSTTSSSTSPASALIGEYNKENVSISKMPGGDTSNAQQRVRCINDDERTRKIIDMSDQYLRYKQALEEQSLRVIRVSGDGNCLFRAVAHQIYGDEAFHEIVRQKCMDYMESEAEFFSQFIVGGRETFHLYIQAKRMNACWGDDPEIEVRILCIFMWLKQV
jgi:OTU domain-containing protein 5